MPLYAGAVGADEYLYHYTCADTAIRYVLGNGTLLMSPFAGTNDPREKQPWTMGFSMAEPDRVPNDLVDQALAEVGQRLRQDVLLACLVQDDPRPDVPEAGVELGRGWGHSRMWEQYADKHKGVCVIFDRPALIQAAQDVAPGLEARPVVYSDAPPRYTSTSMSLDAIVDQGMDAVVERHVQENIEPLFFTKNRDWEAEHEFRLLSRGAESDELFIDVTSSIVGLVAGPETGEQQTAALREGLGRMPRAAELTRLRWQNGIPYCEPALGAGPPVSGATLAKGPPAA
jgi:hypothetical protein